MNKISWLFLALFIAAGAFAASLWTKSKAAAEQHHALQTRLQQLESDLRQAQSAAHAAAQSSDFSQNNKLELMRLRNEVSQLRAQAQTASTLETEVAQLRTQIQELRTASTTPSPADTAPANRFTRDQWAYSGNGTPEAALLSGLAAAVNSPNQPLSTATGLQIVERHEISPTEMQMKIYLEGSGEVRSVTLALDQAGWQMTGLIPERADADPMSFYRRNPELMRRYFPHLVQEGEIPLPAE